MRKSAWYMTFLSAAALAGTVGCGDSGVDPCAPGSGLICPDDAGEPDAGVTPDAGDRPDRAVVTGTCGDVGRSGGLCREGACFTGLECFDELFVMGGGGLTARNVFGYPQAMPQDPANPETFVEVETPAPADDVAVTFFTGNLCSEECNSTLRGAADTCGTCAKCSRAIGNDPLGVPVYIHRRLLGETSAFGDDTGICRPHCVFNPETNGGCPLGYSCDPFSNLCLEACRNDAQCQATVVITEAGDPATWIVPDSTRTCSMTTGRCETAGTPAAQVGNPCESSNECAPDFGACIRGGSCAELGCAASADGLCDDGRGICLPNGGNAATLCLEGCATAENCNPGNACFPLFDNTGAPVMLGTYSGVCLGLCDTVDSGIIGGEADQIIPCRSDERCDMPEPDADDMDPDGTCRPSCDPAATVSECETNEVCDPVAGETYGFCRARDGFCREPGTVDCVDGQICDGEILLPFFGRCVNPCTADTDCTVAPQSTCVTDTASALVGLCAQECTMDAECNEAMLTTRFCRTEVGTTQGYCVVRPRP